MKKLLPLLLLPVLAFQCKPKEADSPEGPRPEPARNMSFSIITTYPHDTSAYTQGLQIYQGGLYEGTGNYGKSKLRKVDLATGKSVREVGLDKQYFGEGITILRDTVYQLTWREKKLFVYQLKDFKKIKEYNVDFEGWGLTNDGTHLIISTGGSDLLFYHPDGLRLVKTQTVIEAGIPSFNLNELEFFNGHVYANQYQYPYILKIDPATGNVVAKADLSPLWQRIRRIYPEADVPNGIAYDTESKKIYVTGKLWPELYEIQLGE